MHGSEREKKKRNTAERGRRKKRKKGGFIGWRREETKKQQRKQQIHNRRQQNLAGLRGWSRGTREVATVDVGVERQGKKMMKRRRCGVCCNAVV